MTNKAQLCPVCEGKGNVKNHASRGSLVTCHGCNGKGWVVVEQPDEIDFSQGTYSTECTDKNCKGCIRSMPLPCPHGRIPMGGQDGWKHCPHCLNINVNLPEHCTKCHNDLRNIDKHECNPPAFAGKCEHPLCVE